MTITVRINDVDVLAEEGESLLEVSLRAGFDIPHLCHHPAVEPIGSCRLCLVELWAAGREELTTSCDVRVEAGMQVVTDSELVRRQRTANLELLLARAPGSQRLRALAARYGIQAPRFEPPPSDGLQNCILCELCVRVCAMLGHDALGVLGRGEKKRIGLPFNQPAASCVGCASCAAVCPTDCIKVSETPQARTIWGQSFDFARCRVCGAPMMTERQRQFEIEKNGLPEDSYDTCESCKRQQTSERFAAVTW